MLKISVVAPVLNEQERLPAFLSSVRAQRFHDYEVVLVDGGSTDLTPVIIRAWQRVMPIKLIVDTTRNIGYIRNVGAAAAQGAVLFHTNSDVVFPPSLLRKVWNIYAWGPGIIAVYGRTRPIGVRSVMCQLAYGAYDFLRRLFNSLPWPVRRIRPGGSFLTVRTQVFRRLHGFPQIRVNEDGAFGEKLDGYVQDPDALIRKVLFHPGLYVDHYARRFNGGTLKALGFYSYVLGNFLPLPIFRQLQGARVLR